MAGGAEDVAGRRRRAWAEASEKYLREYGDLLTEARAARLLPDGQRLLGPLLAGGPEVLHPQSGHGLDDRALVAAGARSVLGLDCSPAAVEPAQRRAEELGVPCRYRTAEIPPFPVGAAAFDLVHTGKGALAWLPDLDARAGEDADETRLRTDRTSFPSTFTNDTFPALGAVEHQHTLGEVVTAVVRAGLVLVELYEHPDPFWRPGDVGARARDGRLPDSFGLLARLP